MSQWKISLYKNLAIFLELKLRRRCNNLHKTIDSFGLWKPILWVTNSKVLHCLSILALSQTQKVLLALFINTHQLGTNQVTNWSKNWKLSIKCQSNVTLCWVGLWQNYFCIVSQKEMRLIELLCKWHCVYLYFQEGAVHNLRHPVLDLLRTPPLPVIFWLTTSRVSPNRHEKKRKLSANLFWWSKNVHILARYAFKAFMPLKQNVQIAAMFIVHRIIIITL